MKKLLFTSMFFVLLLSLYGCVDYPEVGSDVKNAKSPEFEKSLTEVVKITATTITVKANISKGNGEKITERGFYYGESENPSEENGAKKLSDPDCTGTGEYSLIIEGLSIYTTYYIRPYAINAKGITYGESLQSGTHVGRPIVETLPLDKDEIRASSATIGGIIRAEGEYKIDTLGFYVYAKDNITKIDTVYYETNYAVIAPKDVAFFYRLTDLKPATLYYVQAFATNRFGRSVGERDSLLTKDGVPKIGDISIKSTSFTDVTLTSSVTNGGDETVIIARRGFCWSSSNATLPTISNDTLPCGDGENDFEGTMTNLEPNTTYYVRAYAISTWNIVGYSDDVLPVQTLTDIPTVETMPVSAASIVNGGADVGGTIKSIGGYPVTDAGICWSTTNPNPTIAAGDHVLPLTALGAVFSGRLTQLKGGTTYYVRAYATNQKDTGYGEVEQFQTPPVFVISGSPFPGGRRHENSTAYFAYFGYLYLVGGDAGANYTDELWRYSISSNQWETPLRSFMDGPMKYQSAATFSYGAYVYGGYNGNNTEKPGIYYYNASENEWSYKDGPPDSAIVFRAVGYSSSQSVFYIGGMSGDTARRDVWRYAPSFNTWKKTDFPVKQYGGVAVVIDEDVYAGMGRDTDGVCNGSLWLTTDEAETWSYKTTYDGLEGSVLGGVVCNKRLYIIDGSYCLIEYNPETNLWTKKSEIPQKNERIFNCIYSEGSKIYIGLGLGLGQNSIIIYDPSWDNN